MSSIGACSHTAHTSRGIMTRRDVDKDRAFPKKELQYFLIKLKSYYLVSVADGDQCQWSSAEDSFNEFIIISLIFTFRANIDTYPQFASSFCALNVSTKCAAFIRFQVCLSPDDAEMRQNENSKISDWPRFEFFEKKKKHLPSAIEGWSICSNKSQVRPDIIPSSDTCHLKWDLGMLVRWRIYPRQRVFSISFHAEHIILIVISIEFIARATQNKQKPLTSADGAQLTFQIHWHSRSRWPRSMTRITHRTLLIAVSPHLRFFFLRYFKIPTSFMFGPFA